MNNPDCDGYEVEFGQYVIKGYDGPVLECDKCGSDMQLKNGVLASTLVAPRMIAKTPENCCAMVKPRRLRSTQCLCLICVVTKLMITMC